MMKKINKILLLIVLIMLNLISFTSWLTFYFKAKNFQNKINESSFETYELLFFLPIGMYSFFFKFY